MSGDADIVSHDPARPGTVVGRARVDPAAVGHAVRAARGAFPGWSALTMDERAERLRAWSAACARSVERIAGLITRETGKILPESRQEAQLLSDKVAVTLEERVRGRIADHDVAGTGTRSNRCTWRPYGVMAVIGPFNFPAHLPNGHWVPALLAGNTVVFKPSEKAPATGALMAELMAEAGMPEGVFNLVQGRGDAAAALVAHEGVDGILFTGSWPVGRRILEANLDRPGRMVALEMGGSNPAVVMDDADLRQAVIECVRCAFLSSGQRCTCTRRVVVHRAVADRFIAAFVAAARSITVGPGDAVPVPFMGPVISREAREAVLAFQRECAARGEDVLLESRALPGEGWFITPGVLRARRFERATDREVFGPVVRISAADGLDDAIEQANATEFGLAASVFTRSEGVVQAAMARLRAGCINVNCGTAGASGKLPFGGLGRSGNLRPAGAAMIDACAYPVASMAEPGDAAVIPPGLTVPERI
ncbi:MAG: aldehyde dehydrogenase family protein [Planctomycetes bacterium]|nr:aldehyde dehydrogenase family protein [Planctomycetota bacterium]